MDANQKKKRICVCVMGDIGHSPRMQYHSLSLASSGFLVDIVGYLESKPHERLWSNENITIHNIPHYKNIEYFPRILNYFLKAVFQSFLLFWMLFSIKKPSHILVQNPPSVPALLIVWLVCRLRNCFFVIDWHNYGFSILSLTIGSSHVLVKLYKSIEFFIGSKSDFNFCVSKSMKADLKHRINQEAIVLYDMPYSFFQKLSLSDKHVYLTKFQSEYFQIRCDIADQTLFTNFNKITGNVELKNNRPAILMSSTSWTEDEDFQLLLDSLYEFDQNHVSNLIKNNCNLKIICIITGKGPLKSHYIEKLSDYSFKHTKFIFPWLAAEDYPKMLACADLGICLHKSSSGLDLPMKVVDMFGSCLPVCAFRYESISELISENKNGLLFDDNLFDLTNCLNKMLQGFPHSSMLQNFKSNLENDFRKLDWDNNWRQHALQIFRK